MVLGTMKSKPDFSYHATTALTIKVTFAERFSAELATICKLNSLSGERLYGHDKKYPEELYCDYCNI